MTRKEAEDDIKIWGDNLNRDSEVYESYFLDTYCPLLPKSLPKKKFTQNSKYGFEGSKDQVRYQFMDGENEEVPIQELW